MAFRFRVDTVVSGQSELVVSGALLDGTYSGPEWVRLRDKSGVWTSATVLQHEIIRPGSWPVVAGDGSVLVLHIATPSPTFELDQAESIVSRGTIAFNEKRIDITECLADPAFWAIQMSLHAASDVVPDPLDGWVFSQDDETREYQRLFERHWAVGIWPFISLPIDGGHFFEIEFSLGVEHQARTWLVDDNGSRVLMGYHSGHFSLPAFRLTEVLALDKSIRAHPSASLLLFFSAYICADETLPIEVVTHWVKQVPGVEAQFIPRLAESLVANLVVPDLRWKFDERLGWTNNWKYSQRNPDSPMSVLNSNDFKSIRQFFTKHMG